jgi:hypothetical protein
MYVDRNDVMFEVVRVVIAMGLIGDKIVPLYTHSTLITHLDHVFTELPCRLFPRSVISRHAYHLFLMVS